MTSRIEPVAPGPESEQALATAIGQAKAADPLAPVTVVVSSSTVALSLRQRLADLGPLAGVRFTDLSRLVELVGAPSPEVDGEGPPAPVTQAAILAAARVALAQSPGLLQPVADHPATAASVAETYHAVRAAGESDLGILASESALARDVVHLIRTMRSNLEKSYYDRQDLIELATSVFDDRSTVASPWAADLGLVVVYLPAPLPAPHVRLLSAMAAAQLSVLVLAGRCGDELADRAVVRFVDALTSSGLFETSDGGPAGVPKRPAGRFASLVNAPDEDEEARSAVRLLIAHAEAGGNLGCCIISYPGAAESEGVSGVAGRVCRQLDEAGIPWSGPRRQLLSERPHGQLLSRLVELSMPVDHGQDLDRGEVISFLASGPIAVGRGLTAGLAAVAPKAGDTAGERDGEGASGLPIGAWDRCSREAGVVSGTEEWRTRLGGLAERLRQRQQASESANTAADQAADLLEVVGRLSELVTRAALCSTWRELAAWCVAALGELLEPGEAREELEDAVGDLGSLDAVEPLAKLAPPERLEHFRQAVAAVLERPSGGGGRFGVGPTVGPLSAVAGCHSELALVLGCREGELPGRGREDPLLSRHAREQVEALAESRDERDRRHLLSLLTASERAVALYARIDVAAGRGRYRSRWLDRDLFAGTDTEVPSFAGALQSVISGLLPAASGSDYELAVLSSPDDRLPFDEALASLDAEYGRRLHVERDRFRGAGLSRFAGYLGLPSEQFWRDTHSATALEDFATCPARFFFSQLLYLRQLEAPERVATIEARERGSLVHSVLERFFDPTDERSGVVPVFDTDARQRLETIADEECRRYELSGKTGKRVNWDVARDQILRDLRLFVEIEVRRAEAGGFVPQAVELCFGRQDAPPLVIDVAGREVKFSGQIDRVDRGPDGQTVVVDYKTGKADRFKDIAKDPLGRGRHLQLPLYAKAVVDLADPAAEVLPEMRQPQREPVSSDGREVLVRGPVSPPVRAEYRFASAVAGFSRVAVKLDEGLDAEFRDVLSTLVSTIDSGCFPPRPGELGWMNKYDNCSLCDFNGVCTTDRAELWERASIDDRMKAYTDLVSAREDA